MDALPPPLAVFLLVFSGWVNRQQEPAIDYLREENRILRAAYVANGFGLPMTSDDVSVNRRRPDPLPRTARRRAQVLLPRGRVAPLGQVFAHDGVVDPPARQVTVLEFDGPETGCRTARGVEFIRSAVLPDLAVNAYEFFE